MLCSQQRDLDLVVMFVTTLQRRVLLLRKGLKSVTTSLSIHHSSSDSKLSVIASSISLRNISSTPQVSSDNASGSAYGELVEASPLSAAEGDDRHFKVIPEFISSSEEQSVLKEVARAFRRKKYQYDHWDGVSITHIGVVFDIVPCREVFLIVVVKYWSSCVSTDLPL